MAVHLHVALRSREIAACPAARHLGRLCGRFTHDVGDPSSRFVEL